MNSKKCPIDDWLCPYYIFGGQCTLSHPEDECDDYYFYNGEEEEK